MAPTRDQARAAGRRPPRPRAPWPGSAIGKLKVPQPLKRSATDFAPGKASCTARVSAALPRDPWLARTHRAAAPPAPAPVVQAARRDWATNLSVPGNPGKPMRLCQGGQGHLIPIGQGSRPGCRHRGQLRLAVTARSTWPLRLQTACTSAKRPGRAAAICGAMKQTVWHIDQQRALRRQKPQLRPRFRAPPMQNRPAATARRRGQRGPHIGLKPLRRQPGFDHAALPIGDKSVAGMLQRAAATAFEVAAGGGNPRL